MNNILKVENLTKTFTLYQSDQKKIEGCKQASFTLREGEFIGITGKSGAGKSTILKCVYRTYLPTEGKITFASSLYGNIDLAQAREQQIIAIRAKEIGYVSQFLKVLPRITARGVVMEALIEMGVTREEAWEEATSILNHFNLPKNLWDAFPNTFSGGEKLRLNLARAMVKRPRLLLLDEPTASLDAASKEYVRDMIKALKASGTSMLGIFHDLDFMEQVVDQTYSMKSGILKKEILI